jgi:hypothetical protein
VRGLLAVNAQNVTADPTPADIAWTAAHGEQVQKKRSVRVMESLKDYLNQKEQIFYEKHTTDGIHSAARHEGN